MQHFHRTHLTADAVLEIAERFFPTLGLTISSPTPRSRTVTGPLGTATITVRAEGGHSSFIEAVTDQMGESRLDRNVKRFFVMVHRKADPEHKLAAAY